MSEAGYLICNGNRFPVDRVELIEGAVVVTATVHIEDCLVMEGPFTLFGTDGRGICQIEGPPHKCHMHRGDVLNFRWHARIGSITDENTNFRRIE
jgi:hypothetical protein